MVVVSSYLIDKEVNVVPTLSEAYDIIELEEIERIEAVKKAELIKAQIE